MPKFKLKKSYLYAIAIAGGALHGLSFRLMNEFELTGDFFQAMSITFLFVVPAVMGFITVFFWPDEKRLSVLKWIFYPWATGALMLLMALLTLLEGLICIIVWTPIFLVLSSLGGYLAGIIRSGLDSKSQYRVLLSVMILPWILSPIEQQFTPEPQFSTAESQIEIAANAATIWENIREVPRIDESEHEFSISHTLGFPKPIEARLVGEGVGAVRYATFEGDVLFVETITEWQPLERLSFTIDPSADIPPTTFDEHVVVGGEYFDVLNGTYRLEQIGPSRYVLHLSSRHRLGTRFNWYTRLWTDFFMNDIQQNILKVVKRRSEH